MTTEKRSGGCHCGKVRYEALIDLSQPVIECNCSHCEIKGLLLSFVPREAVTMLKGEEELSEYRFNTEGIAHMSCKTCGVQVFGRGKKKDGTPTNGINVRTIDDIDLLKIESAIRWPEPLERPCPRGTLGQVLCGLVSGTI